MTRYVIEMVAKHPARRRIKDTKRNKYIKQPHGDDTWSAVRAQDTIAALNRSHELSNP